MTNGPQLFARYAFPPNVLGYCGPADSGLTEGLGATAANAELAHVVTQYEGAWPYLELIGGVSGLDPLDRRVVGAYWIGNELLDGFDTLTWGNSVDDRFRRRAGSRWEIIASGIAGGTPNHAFHVFCVYPWVGLLRSGHAAHALEVIDRCRIRWGTVEACTGLDVIVRSSPLIWDGDALALGEPRLETVVGALGASSCRPGAVVSLHWDYVCEGLDHHQLLHLQKQTFKHLAIVNDHRPALASVLER